MSGRFPLSTPAHALQQLVDLGDTPALPPHNHLAPWAAITTRRLPAPLAPTPAHALVRHG